MVLCLDWGKGEHGAVTNETSSGTVHVIANLPPGVSIGRKEADALQAFFFSVGCRPLSEAESFQIIQSCGGSVQ